MWTYFVIRNYYQYADFDPGVVLAILMSVVVQDMSSNLFDQYLKSIKSQTKKMQDLFKNTLTVIPNGVLIIDIKTKAITYANKEMELIVQTINENGPGATFRQLKSLQQRICEFIICDSHIQNQGTDSALNEIHSYKDSVNESFKSPKTFKGRNRVFSNADAQGRSNISQNSVSFTNGSFDKIKSQKQNLWDFMLGMLETQNLDRKETVFKAKNPKRYIQVKPSLINNGKQLLVICSDITRIKEVESQGRKLRASFFSSVAHELRTPLNSIIPIIKMVLDSIGVNAQRNPINFERLNKLQSIVRNSSFHLQSVIEDALDISRLENNKFQIFTEMMDVRVVVEQVCDIMRFQVEEKGLELVAKIEETVPPRFLSDMKRIKQVLFNLLGNAIKFTFSGRISVSVDFDEGNRLLTGKVSDTGLGIKEADLEKLFKFFGCLVTTKDINRGGMGLGLTISKMIIQQLGGDITVESMPGVGSTFTFTIPIEEYEIPEDLIQSQQMLFGNYQSEGESEEFSPISKKQKTISPMNDETKTNFDEFSCLQVPTNYLGQKMQSFNIKKNIAFKRRQSKKPTEALLVSDITQEVQETTRFADAANYLRELTQKGSHKNLQQLYGELAVKQQILKPNALTELPTQDGSNTQKPRRILCVDDSTYNLFVIKEALYLIDESLHIDTALNGQIAFDKIFDAHQARIALLSNNRGIQDGQIQGSHQWYDLVLLDLHMPLLDGFQTAKLVREAVVSGRMHQGFIKIIALSAISESQFMNNPYSKYFDGFIEKPVNQEKLIAILGAIQQR
ncbi:hypothetical protein FGO68_gene14033 [Halteria grandinella]|uniref:histidine kinase n=1 Tax=Halteria grandinella TaxID=5974 RepID=A0A8J8P171_HALGN|nr:hypothetical protein FGO68_gene14033 [Halteria grandinella]